MDANYLRLFLAVTAIRFRSLGDPSGLPDAIKILCDDALRGLSIDEPPLRRSSDHFDPVRVDGKQATYEVEVRSIDPEEPKKDTP